MYMLTIHIPRYPLPLNSLYIIHACTYVPGGLVNRVGQDNNTLVSDISFLQ